jgi:hypothetical protein
MLQSLKGGPLWAITAIVLAVIGAVTYLASQGTVSGGDVLNVISLVLVGVIGVTTAHVVGQSTITAGVSTVPAPPVPPGPPTEVI